MTHIIQSGFEEIDLSIFRRKSLSKGKKLVYSFHVSNVTEKIDGQYRDISGSVLRGTPGSDSTKKKQNIYLPKIVVRIKIFFEFLYYNIISCKYFIL